MFVAAAVGLSLVRASELARRWLKKEIAFSAASGLSHRATNRSAPNSFPRALAKVVVAKASAAIMAHNRAEQRALSLVLAASERASKEANLDRLFRADFARSQVREQSKHPLARSSALFR